MKHLGPLLRAFRGLGAMYIGAALILVALGIGWKDIALLAGGVSWILVGLKIIGDGG